MQIQRVLVVHRKSLYQIYVREHRDRAVKSALRRGDPVAQRLLASHRTQEASLATTRRTLRSRGVRAEYCWRGEARGVKGFDLVISVGGDGTVLDTAQHIVEGPPLLGLNSDPPNSVGALCAGTADQLDALLDAVSSGALVPTRLTRLRVRLEGRDLFGPCLNDVLFAHACPADMTRFELGALPLDELPERGRLLPDGVLVPVRSSGLWVATAAGSTGGIHSAGGRTYAPHSRRVQYLVREPYAGPGRARRSRGSASFGPKEALVVVCHVRRGMIWADGAHRRHVVPYGQTLVIDSHPSSLELVLRRG
ncbi:MAG: NAD(+)/NADH kinase [Deltaproteobacteria bacterium]|nr:NAD(+)/NADH kinase [Deltaproteobacteria bacterium]